METISFCSGRSSLGASFCTMSSTHFKLGGLAYGQHNTSSILLQMSPLISKCVKEGLLENCSSLWKLPCSVCLFAGHRVVRILDRMDSLYFWTLEGITYHS